MQRSGAAGTVERTEVTRVFIVSEVRLYREGLARLLRRDQRLEVVGRDGATCRTRSSSSPASTSRPRRCCSTSRRPPASRALRQLDAAVPTARIIVLNVSDADEQALIAWAEAGVGGLLARDVDVDDVAQAVADDGQRRHGVLAAARRAAARAAGALGRRSRPSARR